MNTRFLAVSSLEKIFSDSEPQALCSGISGFLNETVSFQVAWRCLDENFTRDFVTLRVESPIAEHVRLRAVKAVPVLYPAPADADDNYLRKTPGLYPDLLAETAHVRLHIWGQNWESAWLDVEADDLAAGSYPIDVVLASGEGETLNRVRVEYRRLNAALPAQTLIRTQWFHCDCLCHYYGVSMFSEPFWAIAERNMRTAARRGINCLLTPIHTPPLDTAVGGERMTAQLVDITLTENGYAFGFDRLARWVRTAQRAGMEWFEMAHLFTQWGAAHAPKIIVKVNGEDKRLFGWETDATGEAYVAFLRAYLPALTQALRDLGIADKCLFHISDEPNERHLDNYMAAKAIVAPLLAGFTIIDALSDIRFYESGAVEHPVPANDHIEPFLAANIPNLWTYYCCGQYKNVSNAFIAMPSARTRILGVQLYKYRIAGFLQWGYNFYHSQWSEYAINPYSTTDGDGFTPGGDCFIVYPGADGEALESIRLMTMNEAMNDLRALNLLESLRGRAFVMRLVEAEGPVTFSQYPTSADYIFTLRQRVNDEIIKALA